MDEVSADAVSSDVAGLDAAQTDARDNYTFTADQQSVINGAAESDVTINVPYTLEDSLANLAAAGEGVVGDAEDYTLTDEAGDLGELNAEQSTIVGNATNTDDYEFTVPVSADDIAGIDAGSAQVTEGNEIVFTVNMNEAAAGDRDVNFVIKGAETSVASPADPVDDLGQKNGVVTIPAGETSAEITLTPNDDGNTEGLEGFEVKVLDSDFSEIASSGSVVIQDPENAGKNEELTTGVDTLEGGAANDTFTGLIDGEDNTTFNPLDSIDGKGGNDTLKLNVTGDSEFKSIGAEVKNVENLVLRSTVEVGDSGSNDALDLSDLKGLTNATVTRADKALWLNAEDTTDYNISGAKKDIDLDGGQNVVVNDATADKAINIGANTVNNGTIDVTDAKQGNGTIAVDGGTDVTVEATSEDTGAINVGQAMGQDLPSGAVSVTQNLENDGTGGGLTGGAITTQGGETVDVTVNANSVAEEATNSDDTTVGTVDVTGDDATTDVTVTQNDNSEQFTKEAEGQKTETAAITFGALKEGESVAIGETSAVVDTDLTFTAAKDLTAEEVAQAFTELTKEDTQSAGGPVENGVFTGGLDAGWTSGAANGADVTFTATTAGDQTNLAVETDDGSSGNAAKDADFKANVTDGDIGTAKATSSNEVSYGTVTVDDNANASIENITLDGYDTATLGSGDSLDALKTLNLANSSGATTLTTATTALDVTVDNVDNGVSLDGTAPSVTDLTLNAEGQESKFDLTAAAVKNLTVNADADLDINGNSTRLAAIETATVAGAGNVALGDLSEDGLETVDASASTGNVSVTVDGEKADVTTGAGNDNVTVDTADISKDIDLGAGNDTLTLSKAQANVPTGTVDGGAGVNTVAMTTKSADVLSNNSNFGNSITNFGRLTVSDAAGSDNDTEDTVKIDLGALGFSYVTSNGTVLDASTAAKSDILQLNNMANDGTLAIEAAAAGDNTKHEVNVTDADKSDDNVLNLVVSGEDTIEAGTVTANDVETLNIEAEDVFLDTTDDGKDNDDNDAEHTLTAGGDSVESIVVTGDDLDLTTDSDVLTSVDASAMSGGITYTADAANEATTVLGGQGTDALTAEGKNDVLKGGAGNDKLTGADLTELWGGDGNDTFAMNTPSNANSYSTIMDIGSGDVIEFTDDKVFASSGVELASTAKFTDYANATVKELDDGGNDVAWFQFDNNTYIIESDGVNTDNGSGTTDDFENGADSIIKIDGEEDLSLASYNQNDGTLEIA